MQPGHASGREAQAGREPERAALARRAVHADIAAHEPREVLADGQAEAGAAEAPGGGGIRLREALEQPARLLPVEPDARVAHAEVQQRGVGLPPFGAHAEDDLTARCELHGIARVVEQDLLQAQGVAQQVLRHVGRHFEDEFQAFRLALLRDQRRRLLQQLVQVDLPAFEFQLAGLDLGEVEDVVDDAQQVVAGGLHVVEITALLGVQARLQQQVRQADDGVQGRADLVAHVGQERGLRLGRIERHLPHALEFAFAPAQVGDVHGDGDLAPIAHRLEDDPHDAAVVGRGLVRLARFVGVDQRLGHRGLLRRVEVGPQRGNRRAARLVVARAAVHRRVEGGKGAPAGVVDQHDAGLGVEDGHAIWQCLDRLGEQRGEFRCVCDHGSHPARGINK